MLLPSLYVLLKYHLQVLSVFFIHISSVAFTSYFRFGRHLSYLDLFPSSSCITLCGFLAVSCFWANPLKRSSAHFWDVTVVMTSPRRRSVNDGVLSLGNKMATLSPTDIYCLVSGMGKWHTWLSHTVTLEDNCSRTDDIHRLAYLGLYLHVRVFDDKPNRLLKCHPLTAYICNVSCNVGMQNQSATTVKQ